MRLYGFGLMSLLWALSLTHEKAMFPVGVVLVGVAVVQLRVLRFWPALFVGLLAWISAAFGLSPFAEKVLELTAFANVQLLSLAAASALLLYARQEAGRRTASFCSQNEASRCRNPQKTTRSLVLTLALELPKVVHARHRTPCHQESPLACSPICCLPMRVRRNNSLLAAGRYPSSIAQAMVVILAT